MTCEEIHPSILYSVSGFEFFRIGVKIDGQTGKLIINPVFVFESFFSYRAYIKSMGSFGQHGEFPRSPEFLRILDTVLPINKSLSRILIYSNESTKFLLHPLDLQYLDGRQILSFDHVCFPAHTNYRGIEGTTYYPLLFKKSI